VLLRSNPSKLDRQHEKANLENTSPLRVPFPVVITTHVGFILYSLSAKCQALICDHLNGLVAQFFFGSFYHWQFFSKYVYIHIFLDTPVRVLLTFPTCTHLFTHFNLTLALPNPLSSPLPSSLQLSHSRLNRLIFIAKYVRVRLTNIKCSSVTYVTQDGIWTAFSHPLQPFHNGTWECPQCTPRHLLPQASTRHLRLPSPILNFDSD